LRVRYHESEQTGTLIGRLEKEIKKISLEVKTKLYKSQLKWKRN
jgi:hypothetical protein